MSLQTIRDHALAITADVDDLINPEPPPPPAIVVRPGDNLLSVLEQAPAGALVQVDPLYQGDLGTVTLRRPVRIEGLLPLGPERVTPALVTGPVLRSAAITCGAPDIQFAKLKLIGNGSTLLTAGDRTVFDQCVGLGRGTLSQHRGIAANAVDILVTRSHIGDIWLSNDTQAVWCYAFTRNLTVRDCFLEASGENFMAGGADGPTAESIPDGILLERCTLFKPEAWKNRGDVGVKNALELKNCRNFIGRDLEIENVWGDAQNGIAIVLTVRNQSNRAPWSTIENVLLERIRIKDIGGGISILGRDDTYASQVMRNVVCRQITMDNLSWSETEIGRSPLGRPFLISGGPTDLVLEDIDATVNLGGVNGAILFNQIQHPCQNLQFRRCVLPEGLYGVSGQAPVPVGVGQIQAHAPGYSWESMTVRRMATPPRFVAWPAGTTIVQP